ncbi:hypothetical protein POM88_031836 [Heracleum sosnowskyi]|uniref:CCHC-type domain-containing protein n=1 Tax=Heracleum sosnowskyi TaxID=360622 RepID=A0AAD8I091_9APIA|nr:hypothetical protein POM88_031836 [Heracleum sosnowskyi]
MEALKKIHKKAYEWLAAKPRSQWSRYCTKTVKKLNMSIKLASKATPVWNCGDKYHVTMTCALKKAEKGNASATREDGMEQDEVRQWEKKSKCSYCNEQGHNSRTCPTKKVDMETKRKEDLAKNPEILSNFLQKIKATQDDLNAQKIVAENGVTIAQKSPPRTKQLARKNPRSTPLKNATLVKSHGGVVKPFKPPSQTAAGVEYFERNGQQFTTLKQLEAHIRKNKKQAVMDKD